MIVYIGSDCMMSVRSVTASEVNIKILFHSQRINLSIFLYLHCINMSKATGFYC